MKNNFSAWLIDNAGTGWQGDTLVLDVRVPWYRALPLSVMQFDSVSLDGAPVSLEGAELELNGKRFPLAALPDLTGEFWFIQDSGFLRVPAATKRPGATQQVELQFTMYPPYIPMLTWMTRGDAQLRPN